jgi:hypothetical protein
MVDLIISFVVLDASNSLMYKRWNYLDLKKKNSKCISLYNHVLAYSYKDKNWTARKT